MRSRVDARSGVAMLSALGGMPERPTFARTSGSSNATFRARVRRVADTTNAQFYESFIDLQTDLSADVLLRAFCQAANESDLEVGVRLFTASGVLSGLLVGGGKYFRALADEIDPAEDRSDKDAPRSGLARSFLEMASSYDTRVAEVSDPEHAASDDDARVVYVHLKDAWLYSPSNQNPLLVGLWRGRLTGVVGWSLGTYGTSG